MNECPLLFTFRDLVEGPGFVAGVICNGRALLVNEGEEGWHVSGVEPGALSEMGASEWEAYHFFRKAYVESLRVLAYDSSDYEAFAGRVEEFFRAKDAEEESRWSAAREALRSGAVPDGAFKTLPKETAEEPRGVQVNRVDYQAKPAPDQMRALAKGSVVSLAGPKAA